MALLPELLQKFLAAAAPKSCAACGEGHLPVCAKCESDLLELRPIVESEFSGIPVFAVGSYQSALGKVIIEFKNSGRYELGKLLSISLEPCWQRLSAFDKFWIATAPRNPQNYFRRGFDPVRKILGFKRSARLLNLRWQRATRKQQYLSAADRQLNRSGSIYCSQKLRSDSVIIFDDVMTTGATVSELIRAVTAAGGKVCAIVLLAIVHRI